MKFLRQLSPTGWAVVASIALIAFVGMGLARPSFLGFQFDPFGMDKRKIESLTAERDTAESNGAARGLEAQGERDQAQRVETYHHQVVEVRTITAEAVSQARSATDAQEPLADPDADSLLNHQRRLCLARPGVCRPAPAVPPGSSDPAL